MRKTSLIALTAAVLLVPTAVLATNSRFAPVDRQVIATRHDDHVFSSTQWRGLVTAKTECPAHERGMATVSLSLEGGSAPVQVRVKSVPLDSEDAAEPFIARPGAVPFSVGGRSDSGAFTFMADVGGASNNTARQLSVQVRVPSGNPATVTASSLSVLYGQGSCG
jgi:hypothetical protein